MSKIVFVKYFVNELTSLVSSWKCKSPRSLITSLLLSISFFLTACSQHEVTQEEINQIESGLQIQKQHDSVFGAINEFIGSPYPDIELTGLFKTHPAVNNQIAVLNNGDDSFAARIQTLKNASTSIRIQALVFTADEAGLYITEILKQKKKEGLDIRVIVDAFSNPKFQTQRMFFDLKQNGIKVEGYEAMLLQWINEIPIPLLMPHAEHGRLDKRFHEKMWLIDAETDHGVAIVGGLNVANEYFRVDESNPDFFWRDQDVIVKGAVIKDMVTAFDRNFDYFLAIKKSRGIFNTNLYWDMTRSVLAKTGKIHFHFNTNEKLNKKVRVMAKKSLQLDYHPGKVRFFQNRPRYKATYIGQSYIKSILSAKTTISIANAYFIPSKEFILALKDAARRCVSINIITNSTQTNDLPEITMVGRESYLDMMSVNNEDSVKSCSLKQNGINQQAGIKIWEWQGKTPSMKERNQGTMHSKYAIFDNKISIVSSFNLDPRSAKLNSESALIFESKPLAIQLSQRFHKNDLSYSLKINHKQAKEFINPESIIYKIEKNMGDLLKNEL